MTKIWDCFMFGGELDLLECRLRELGDVVDHFILCESALTHAGSPKPLHYLENRERFKPWNDQIVHVVAELPDVASHAWRREELQRRFLRDAIKEHAGPDDGVVVADIDEFVDRDVLRTLAQNCSYPVTLGMAHAIYFANWWMPTTWIAPPMFARGSQLGDPALKPLLGEPHEQWEGFRQRIVDGCGVHISFSGGPEGVRRKFLGNADTYLNAPRFTKPGFIERCIEFGVHFEGWRVLDRLAVDRLPPILQRMNECAPELFDFSSSQPMDERRAMCGYAWLRRKGSIPDRVVDWLDEHPRVVTAGVAAPLFRAVDSARALRRRYWDRPVPPSFLPLESTLRTPHELKKHPEWLNPIHLSVDDLERHASHP
jgi:hypothetical protein